MLTDIETKKNNSGMEERQGEKREENRKMGEKDRERDIGEEWKK